MRIISETHLNYIMHQIKYLLFSDSLLSYTAIVVLLKEVLYYII
jgi:hypothetical protein